MRLDAKALRVQKNLADKHHIRLTKVLSEPLQDILRSESRQGLGFGVRMDIWPSLPFPLLNYRSRQAQHLVLV